MRSSLRVALVGLLLCGPRAVGPSPRLDEAAVACPPVPIRLVRGLPVTMVGVGGVEAELMVDLGGFDAIRLDPSLLEKAGASLTGRKRRFENALGQKLSAREFRLDRVTLGTHVVEDVRGLESVRTAEWAPGIEAGYVGLELLRRFDLTFDYAGGVMRVEDEGCPVHDPPGSSPWRTARMSSTRDGVHLSMTIDGRKTRVLLDTGASYSTLRPKAAPEDARVRTRHGEFYRPTRMSAAGTAMSPVEFYVLELPGPRADAILGCNFFAENEVRIEFRAGTVAFRPASPPSPHPCPSPVEMDAP